MYVCMYVLMYDYIFVLCVCMYVCMYKICLSVIYISQSLIISRGQFVTIFLPDAI